MIGRQRTNSLEPLVLSLLVYSCVGAGRAFDGRCSFQYDVSRRVIGHFCGIGRAPDFGFKAPPEFTHHILIEYVVRIYFAAFVLLGDGYAHSII